VKRRLRLFLLASLLLPNLPALAQQTPQKIYSVQRLKHSEGPCEKSCARFLLEFPIIERAASAQITEKLNTQIQKAVAQQLSMGENQPQTIEQAAQNFFSWYREIQEEEDLPDLDYELQLQAQVETFSERFLCLRLKSYFYSGGAHGMPFTNFLVFDLNTGEPLQLEDLLQPWSLEPLRRKLERNFRVQKDISPEAPLNQEDFLFELKKLPFSGVWGLGERGLIFYYNVYEIAPYSSGSIEVFVSVYELENILKPDLLKHIQEG